MSTATYLAIWTGQALQLGAVRGGYPGGPQMERRRGTATELSPRNRTLPLISAEPDVCIYDFIQMTWSRTESCKQMTMSVTLMKAIQENTGTVPAILT